MLSCFLGLEELGGISLHHFLCIIKNYRKDQESAWKRKLEEEDREEDREQRNGERGGERREATCV